MRGTLTILAVLITVNVIAQSPEKMSYQAVIRGNGNTLVTNHAVGMRISILQGSTTGIAVYTETQTPNTNANGLISIEIGGGAGFSAISWANGPYFIKTETDPGGGTSYSITGISQLLSVPYSLNAKRAETADYNNLTNQPALNLSNWNTAFSWGNHAGLYRISSWVPSWTDVTGKPAFSTVASSGNYNDLINLPSLFNGSWTSLTNKPATVAGFGITDAMTTAHVTNSITSTNISNWNTAYSWGNHAGLYRISSWVPSWTDVTGKPAFATVASSGNYNDLINLPSLFNGSWTSLTNKPATVAGFGITDAMTTSHAANGITNANITNWTAAYGWGNHATAGYVTDSRTLTINGTSQNLTDNRSWSVGTVTSVALSLPGLFTITGSPVTSTGTLTAALASQTANTVFASPNGSPGVPGFRVLAGADIPGLDWSKINSGKPTTLTGYGITDGVSTLGDQSIAGTKTFTGTISASNKTITNVAAPVNATDAATKAYVDALLQRIELLEGTKIKDKDGNVYGTVIIGIQIWMSENLKTTKYNDGTAISYPGTNKPAWQSNTTGAYAWYNNDEVSYKNIYGAFYNWYALDAASNGNKNVCPTGWHVPADAEWTTLFTFLGGESVAGGKIKETGTAHWLDPNTGATNSSGFTALPGGFLWFDGTFYDITYIGVFWSSTAYNSTNAFRIWPHYSTGAITRDNTSKNNGFSVRCLKD